MCVWKKRKNRGINLDFLTSNAFWAHKLKRFIVHKIDHEYHMSIHTTQSRNTNITALPSPWKGVYHKQTISPRNEQWDKPCVCLPLNPLNMLIFAGPFIWRIYFGSKSFSEIENEEVLALILNKIYLMIFLSKDHARPNGHPSQFSRPSKISLNLAQMSDPSCP